MPISRFSYEFRALPSGVRMGEGGFARLPQRPLRGWEVPVVRCGAGGGVVVCRRGHFEATNQVGDLANGCLNKRAYVDDPPPPGGALPLRPLVSTVR